MNIVLMNSYKEAIGVIKNIKERPAEDIISAINYAISDYQDYPSEIEIDVERVNHWRDPRTYWIEDSIVYTDCDGSEEHLNVMSVDIY